MNHCNSGLNNSLQQQANGNPSNNGAPAYGGFVDTGENKFDTHKYLQDLYSSRQPNHLNPEALHSTYASDLGAMAVDQTHLNA